MTRFARREQIDITQVDNEIFLLEPGSDEIYYLDEVTSGVWRLLAEPVGIEEIVAVFSAAFPDAGRERIQADLTAALQDLVARGLVTEVD